MLIGVEATALQGNKSGVGYFTENLLSAVMNTAPEHRYMLFFNRDVRNSWRTLAGETIYDRRFFPLRAAWMQTALPLALGEVAPDFCHFTNYLAPLTSVCPGIVTIYDMTVFITPQFHPAKKQLLDRLLIPRVARRAAAIITPSHSSRNDIIRLLGVPAERVHVVGAAAAARFRPVTDEQELARLRQRYELDSPFILYVGTIEPRKNLVRLLQAFAQLKQQGLPHKLLLVGQAGWKYEPIYAELDRLGLQGAAIFTGYVPLDDLPGLYTLAESMAFPSLYEGFGLPVVEAMACGTPVLTSRSSSLVELARDSALLVDPLSVDEIAQGLYRLHAEPQLRVSLRERGLRRANEFSWERASRTTLAVYERVSNSRNTNRVTYAV